MSNASKLATTPLMALLASVILAACGGAPPPPPAEPEGEEDVDLVSALVGDVEIEEEELEEEEAPEAYTGPTSLTIRLKVVDDKDPAGSFTLKDAEGTVLIEGGAFGEPVEVNQGAYTVEYTTPDVFGTPTDIDQDVAVSGREQTIEKTFPAGQIKLHTYRGKNKKRCRPTEFTVFDKDEEKELEGTGETCEPLVLETGHYEVRLELNRKKYQPVEMRINAEQKAESYVQLER